MSDDSNHRDNPLDRIAKSISAHVESITPAVESRPTLMPVTTTRTFRQFDSRNPPSDSPLGPIGIGGAYNGPKNEDVPRAGELSSQVFNDLTTRIISELRETVESQITDAANRRAHAKAQMESLMAEIDKAFGELEAHLKKHQEKVNTLAEAVRKKVEDDTKQMIALSQRLRVFADSVNGAHETFFNEDEHPAKLTSYDRG